MVLGCVRGASLGIKGHRCIEPSHPGHYSVVRTVWKQRLIIETEAHKWGHDTGMGDSEILLRPLFTIRIFLIGKYPIFERVPNGQAAL